MAVGLIILIIYLAILLELLLGDRSIAVRYLHFGYLALYLVSSGLFFFLLLRRSKKTKWLFPAFMFISFYYFQPYFSYSQPASSTPKESTAYSFLSFSVNSINQDYSSVSQLLKQHPTDIVCLQEIPYAHYQDFMQSMNAVSLNYHHVYSRKKALMILSKHPIIPNKTMPFLQATVNVEGKKLKIWNIHSPKSLTRTHYQGYYFDRLKQDIEADLSTYKVLCGDFNSTPHNAILPGFSDIFQAAYQSSKAPFSFTYPTPKAKLSSPVPLIKIDYILMSKNFDIDQYKRLTQYANSDHYPIFALARFRDH